jgi:transcriptional regulator with XRE-family HTH domain
MAKASAPRLKPLPPGLGNYLRALREKKELTMKQVAKGLNFSSYQLIYNMEHEKCLPPVKQIKKLAGIYGVPDKEIRMAIVNHVIAKTKRKYGFKP